MLCQIFKVWALAWLASSGTLHQDRSTNWVPDGNYPNKHDAINYVVNSIEWYKTFRLEFVLQL